MSELEMQHVSLVLGHRLSSLEISAVFSFKESVFKCLYPKVGQWFWFLDVEISTYDQQSMACQLKRDLGPYPKGTFVHGNRWIVAPNRLATCAIHPDVLSQK
jgi:4'-phosphopantetheinyl transferase EntD